MGVGMPPPSAPQSSRVFGARTWRSQSSFLGNGPWASCLLTLPPQSFQLQETVVQKGVL